MGDFALQLGPPGEYVADMAIVDDDVLSDEGLRTSVYLSIFCDRRAEDGDPFDGDDRRGWWADELLADENPGDRIGSRRWLLLDRGKLRPGLPRLLEQYDREALQWLIDDGVASEVSVTVTVTRNPGAGATVNERIEIQRPSGPPAEFNFAHVWEGEANAV